LAACKGGRDLASGAPFGWMDSAGSSAGETSLQVGHPLVVRGWSAGRDEGAPVVRVAIYMDLNFVQDADLGQPREDIAVALGDRRFATSGWSATLDTSLLGAGTHLIRAVAYDTRGASQQIGGERTITLSPAARAPLGKLDGVN